VRRSDTSSLGRAGGEVDDPATGAARDHVASDGAGDEEGAFDVGVHDGVPLGFGHVDDEGAGVDTGVVDQNVDGAEGGEGGFDHGFDRGGVADVDLGGDGGRTGFVVDGLRHGFGAVGVQIRDDDGVSVRRERFGDGLADTMAGAGDDD
jgi:hypothetical protein